MPVTNAIKRGFAEIVFLLNKTRELSPPGEPLLDAPTRAVFEREAARANVVVENGAGGTTLIAARAASLVVSVESDAFFVNRWYAPSAAIAFHRACWPRTSPQIGTLKLAPVAKAFNKNQALAHMASV